MPHIEHIYYEEAGAGRPLILVHCPALSHIYWRPVMERLRHTFRCIAIDLRGHGKSGKGETPWTFRDIAGDLGLLTARLGLDRPVLVGYSSGATIALQAMVDQPETYGALVSVSGFSECCTLSMRIKIRLGLLAVHCGLTRMIGPNVIGTNSVGPAHTQAMLPDARRVNPVSLRSFLLETQRVNLTAELHKIKVPALLVYGAADDWMHNYGRILQREIPHARSVFFPNTDHRVPTRRPAEFARQVEEFLEMPQDSFQP